MSLDSALLISSGGLSNISRQMAVVSNNIANASTPDYARELSTQTSLTAGGVGFGVLSGPVIREIDLQLQSETFRQNATVASLNTRQQALQPLDAAQGIPGAGSDLGSLLGKLQDAFITLQAGPSSAAAQTHVVGSAAVLAGKINSLSAAYGTARQNAQDNIKSGVDTFNTSIATISELTDRIIAAQNERQGTADLENQRDVAMHAMSSLVDVAFIRQADGGMLAATGGGVAISLRAPAPQFSQASAVLAPQSFYPGGGVPGIMLGKTDVTQQLTGGQIGASIELRDKTLPVYQGELDEFSQTLRARFAAQGLQLFSTPSGAASLIFPPPLQTGYIGYAGTISVNPAVLAAPSAVRDGNLLVVGSPAGASAFTPNPPGGPASFSGLTDRVLSFAFGAQAQVGVPQPAPAVSGLGPLGNLSAPYSAPQDMGGFATALVATQSADIGATTTRLDTETSVQASLKARVTSSSGVSTDGELAKMVGLQNAYGANARIIAASQAMWTQLLNAVI